MPVGVLNVLLNYYQLIVYRTISMIVNHKQQCLGTLLLITYLLKR
jgi:hypothetical protein